MSTKKGIYCLEVGEWFGSLQGRHSVEPILQLLRDSPLAVPFIHRDIATEVELRYYLRKWTQGRQRNYPILYLAFHGSPGSIHLFNENGRLTEFAIDELFDVLHGRCARRVIHFGACSVLDMHGNRINRYLRTTRAAAISGYRAEVDWIDSAAFETAYLAQLQYGLFTYSGLHGIEQRVAKLMPHLLRTLEFNIKIAR